MVEKGMELRPIRAGQEKLALNVIGSVLTAMKIEMDGVGRSELATLPNSFRGHGGKFWVAEANGAIVGTVGVKPVKDGGGEWAVKWLCLVPAWRGMGMGRMMAERAIDFARQKQATRICTEAHTADPALLPLFQSLRFQVVEDVDLKTHVGTYTLRRIFPS